MTPKPPKPKTCKVCKVKYTPSKPLQSVCSPLCAIEHMKVAKAKKERKERRVAKEKLKSRGQWIKEVQQVFNKWVRLRDADDGCVSCDKTATWQGQWHASHFYATSTRPNLRFNEYNVHKACSVCNNYKHGNLTPYRERLIHKIGIENVNILDEDKAPVKYTIQELKDLKAKYAKLAKELDCKMQN